MNNLIYIIFLSIYICIYIYQLFFVLINYDILVSNDIITLIINNGCSLFTSEI